MTDEQKQPQPQLPRWALVVQHMLNPNGVQGLPIIAPSAQDVRELVQEALLERGGVVNVLDENGAVTTSVILGAGMMYVVRPWADFLADAQRAQQAAAEAQLAAQNGIVKGLPGMRMPNGRGRG